MVTTKQKPRADKKKKTKKGEKEHTSIENNQFRKTGRKRGKRRNNGNAKQPGNS